MNTIEIRETISICVQTHDNVNHGNWELAKPDNYFGPPPTSYYIPNNWLVDLVKQYI